MANRADAPVSENSVLADLVVHAHNLWRAKHYDKAIEAFQKCLDIRVKAFGEEHVETAAAYMGLGMAYLGKNDFEKAEEFDSKSKAILQKTGGVTTINRNPQSQLKGPVVQVFKARSKLKRKP